MNINDKLTNIITAYRGDEPMNGDEIDTFMGILELEVRYHEGDISEKEYLLISSKKKYNGVKNG